MTVTGVGKGAGIRVTGETGLTGRMGRMVGVGAGEGGSGLDRSLGEGMTTPTLAQRLCVYTTKPTVRFKHRPYADPGTVGLGKGEGLGKSGGELGGE